MARSLLKIATQVDGPKLFDDVVASAHTAGVAESTSIALQPFLEIMMSNMKDVKGTTNWYDAGTSDVETLAAQPNPAAVLLVTPIVAQNIATGTGASTLLGATITGNAALVDDAVSTNHILAHGSDSTGTNKTKTRVMVLNASTNDPIEDANGNEVYAEFELRTSADANVLESVFPVTSFDGTTDYQLKLVYFSDIAGTPTSFSFATLGTTNIDIYYRKQMTLATADKFFSVDGVSQFTDTANEVNIGNLTYTNDNDVTDGQTVTASIDALDTAHGPRTYTEQNDVTNAETITASLDALDVRVGDSTFTSDFDVTDGADITDNLDALDLAHGGRTYTEQNYVTNAQTFTASIDALDQQMADNAAAISDSNRDPHWEKLASTLTAETAHALPGANTYTLDATEEGLNMKVYVDGQLLRPDTTGEDMDYEETSTTTVTFHFTIPTASNILYDVFKA